MWPFKIKEVLKIIQFWRIKHSRKGKLLGCYIILKKYMSNDEMTFSNKHLQLYCFIVNYIKYAAMGLPWWLSGKRSACQCRKLGFDPWVRSPGVGNGYPLQYSCLENSMDTGAWRAAVHRVSKSRTRLKGLSMNTYTHGIFWLWSLLLIDVTNIFHCWIFKSESLYFLFFSWADPWCFPS